MYYNYAYLQNAYNNQNLRSIWYKSNRKRINVAQSVFIILLFLGCTFFIFTYYKSILHQKIVTNILLILIFAIGILYYPNKYLHYFNIRKAGWLKPFLIGFVWTGIVTLIPLYCNAIITDTFFYNTKKFWLFFLVNFLFISGLSILFYVKYYTDDYNAKLKTLVLHFGIEKAINNIVTPLIATAAFLHIFYIKVYHGGGIIVMLLVPFYALVMLKANKLNNKKTILYYLIIIDGFLLLKAMMGIVIRQLV